MIIEAMKRIFGLFWSSRARKTGTKQKVPERDNSGIPYLGVSGMEDEEQVALLTHDVSVWNEWRKEYPEIRPALSSTNLRGANLRGANLRWADLNGATLTGADLREADLREAALREADLRGANLRGANLNRAMLSLRANLHRAILRDANLRRATFIESDLTEADLRGAVLHEADFGSANLSRANLRGAKLFETVLGDTDLTAVKGLDSCIHEGPSTIDHRTLMKSGSLPLEFLRGCGLPDSLIDYLPSLWKEPFHFYSCFISYSSKDQEFAERLHADLQNKGVRCWFAPHDIQGGKKTHEQIDQAIHVHDKLLLVLSQHSINSPWVEFEIRRARKREVQEQRRILFPIRLVDYETIEKWECFDADTRKDLATEIREYYIPDFSNWKNYDEYQKAFEHLLRDLKAEDVKK